jgi:hypothetical protein
VDLISSALKGDSPETQSLAMSLKQAAYREMKSKEDVTIKETPIPDPKENEQLFGRFRGFYSLDWKTFVADYDKFHSDPMNYKIAAPAIPDDEEPDLEQPPSSTDMAGGNERGHFGITAVMGGAGLDWIINFVAAHPFISGLIVWVGVVVGVIVYESVSDIRLKRLIKDFIKSPSSNLDKIFKALRENGHTGARLLILRNMIDVLTNNDTIKLTRIQAITLRKYTEAYSLYLTKDQSTRVLLVGTGSPDKPHPYDLIDAIKGTVDQKMLGILASDLVQAIVGYESIKFNQDRAEILAQAIGITKNPVTIRDLAAVLGIALANEKNINLDRTHIGPLVNAIKGIPDVRYHLALTLYLALLNNKLLALTKAQVKDLVNAIKLTPEEDKQKVLALALAQALTNEPQLSLKPWLEIQIRLSLRALLTLLTNISPMIKLINFPKSRQMPLST